MIKESSVKLVRLLNSNNKDHNIKNNIYTYFIIAKKVNGIWKYKKSNKQCGYAPLYHKEDNLVNFHIYVDNYYFIKNSTEINPDFFNSTLFILN